MNETQHLQRSEIMTTFTESFIETFNIVSCYSCTARFAIPSELYRRVVTNHSGSVHCPACGALTCWPAETEDQKRIKQLESKLNWDMEECARQKRNQEAAEASLRGVVTRIKRRIGSGICPCCKRSFKQLSQHMAHKHPDYTTKEKTD